MRDLPEGWSEEILRARSSAVEREVCRLYGLSDRWLAEALLRLARSVRRRQPARTADPGSRGHCARLTWQIVPEAARRLGATRLLPGEGAEEALRALAPARLRAEAGASLLRGDIGALGFDTPGAAPTPEEILGRAIGDGNPVIFGLDRLVPAGQKPKGRADWVERHLREISRSRGRPETVRWSPEIGAESRLDRPIGR